MYKYVLEIISFANMRLENNFHPGKFIIICFIIISLANFQQEQLLISINVLIRFINIIFY